MTPAKSTADLTNKLLVAIQSEWTQCRIWKMTQGGGYPSASIKAAIGLLMRGQCADALALLRRSPVLMFGGLAGLPDLDGVTPDGRRLGIEVKFGADRQSEDQKLCQRIYEERGAVYVIARDVDGCLAELRAKI